ncbi:hypothetical protein EV360DRAFT_39300 [Lentinula raphanica]|nr:hypothetical protein EV360DRAFT_39300 [Lentinula raphanica]
MSRLYCQFPGCTRTFKRNSDLTKHVNSSRTHQEYYRRMTPSSSPSPSPSPAPDDDRYFESVPLSPIPQRSSPQAIAIPVRQDTKIAHEYLTGQICDEHGNPLPADTPSPENLQPDNPWAPFDSEAHFHVANFLYQDVEMSQGNIDQLMDVWARYQRELAANNSCENCVEVGSPFHSHTEMYDLIDSISHGDAPWKCLQTVVDEHLSTNAPEWKKTSYQVWYRDPDTVVANILSNPEFIHDFDVAPYIHLDGAGVRRWADFMSGNFAWRHATRIQEDDTENCAEGAMLVPIILGADKTTVSVATGHVEYHPLYLSIGNITNAARRAHRNAVIPIGFLAIPKADRKYDDDADFRIFKKRLYHNSIAAILRSLKPGMKTPVIRKCPDGHFRKIIYDLAAFIADYPEQVFLSGIVQGWCTRCNAMYSELDGPADRRTRDLDQMLRDEYGGEGRTLWDNFGMDEHVIPFTEGFPRADIHEMMSPDLLHQIIKGCFKDMLVEWTLEYLKLEHGEARANEILDDIDRRLAAVPAFPGIRYFPEGRRFKQWTGNDSKALMKIFLPAVSEYLPTEMMQCLAAFLDFCYLVRRPDINEHMIQEIQAAIDRFHSYRDQFIISGVRKHFSIPRMHAIVHYPLLIQEFGSPNGLCSSITESRHISAVKKPWRRSNKYHALSQILLTNQRVDKLLALQSTLVSYHLLPPSYSPPPDAFESGSEDVGPVDSGRATTDVKLARTRERHYPRFIAELAEYIKQPQLELLARQFLRDQLNLPADTPDANLPFVTSKINVYHSAVAVFYAPSDISGIRGMKRERIRSTPSWRHNERRDTALVIVDEEKPGFRGMSAARVLLFFSFRHNGLTYPCALVHWFNTYGQRRDPKTGLWMVRPAYWDQNRREQNPCLAVVHLDTLIRGVHLIPVYGSHPIPSEVKFNHSLDIFKLFYVNKYADYHANEILF